MSRLYTASSMSIWKSCPYHTPFRNFSVNGPKPYYSIGIWHYLNCMGDSGWGFGEDCINPQMGSKGVNSCWSRTGLSCTEPLHKIAKMFPFDESNSGPMERKLRIRKTRLRSFSRVQAVKFLSKQIAPKIVSPFCLYESYLWLSVGAEATVVAALAGEYIRFSAMSIDSLISSAACNASGQN